MARKTPVLLRRGPMSGAINALTNYRWIRDGKIIKVVGDGKHDVSGDFDALVLEELLSNGAEHVIAALDAAADDEPLTVEEIAELRTLRERLKAMVERHNARVDGRDA